MLSNNRTHGGDWSFGEDITNNLGMMRHDGVQGGVGFGKSECVSLYAWVCT